MPNPPRFVLPPALLARVEALRAGATAGRPTRQAVVEAALGAGLGVLEVAHGARGGTDGREGMAGAADAPTGLPAPALAHRRAPTWQPPPNDPRWAFDGVGKPYARESHTIGAMVGGKRVEVAVSAGDTVDVVRRALAVVATGGLGAPGGGAVG